jgi:hypothetical protein
LKDRQAGEAAVNEKLAASVEKGATHEWAGKDAECVACEGKTHILAAIRVIGEDAN